MPDRHLRRASAARRLARVRAAYLARRIGIALREARLAAGSVNETPPSEPASRSRSGAGWNEA